MEFYNKLKELLDVYTDTDSISLLSNSIGVSRDFEEDVLLGITFNDYLWRIFIHAFTIVFWVDVPFRYAGIKFTTEMREKLGKLL